MCVEGDRMQVLGTCVKLWDDGGDGEGGIEET